MRSYQLFLFFVLCFVLQTFALAESTSIWDDKEFSTYDESFEELWIESETIIPPLPTDDVLTEIDMGSKLSGLKLYVDVDNIILDESDGVARLWLILKNNKRAYNGRYEGFRCQTREHKTYAYGNPRSKKTIRKSRNPSWKFITGSPMGTYHKELFNRFICSDEGIKTIAEIKSSFLYD